MIWLKFPARTYRPWSMHHKNHHHHIIIIIINKTRTEKVGMRGSRQVFRETKHDFRCFFFNQSDSLPKSGWCFWLVEANFLCGKRNKEEAPTRTWVLTPHQWEISLFLPRTSFHSDTFGGVAKFRLLSQARWRLILLNFRVLLILQIRTFVRS